MKKFFTQNFFKFLLVFSLIIAASFATLVIFGSGNDSGALDASVSP